MLAVISVLLRLAGATDCDFVDFQGWLAYAYWDGLAFFATGANTGVELQVVADH